MIIKILLSIIALGGYSEDKDPLYFIALILIWGLL